MWTTVAATTMVSRRLGAAATVIWRQAFVPSTTITASSNRSVSFAPTRNVAAPIASGTVHTIHTKAATTNLIINAAGLDRLGIVSDVTGLVIAHGGNVGESVAGRLGASYFSLMMLVSVPVDARDALQQAIVSVPDLSAAVFTVDGVTLDTQKPKPVIGYSGDFVLTGADNPGIVHKITSALANGGLSIDKMETDQEIAPYGGSVLFKMRGTAIAMAPLAKHFDIDKIKAELVELGDSLNCEVTMEDTVDESYQGSFYAG